MAISHTHFHTFFFYLTTPQRWIRADWVHVYEGKEGFHNDIAILSMEETVEFGPKIRPICLPDDDIQV